MELDELRKSIDEIDKGIIDLLNKRTEIVLEIGKLKNSKKSEIFSPAREAEVYKKIESLANGPLPSDSLKVIYREIMSVSLSLEKDMVIAYLGPAASFTNLAALTKFGSSLKYLPCDTISDVFDSVERGNADYGVLPIENSTEGAVRHTLDMFIDSDLKICSEIVIDIKHNLMSNSKLEDIKRVYSNPQAFAQCRLWLRTNLPKAELIDTSSTTVAAKRAAEEDRSAAIGSELAASLYNLKILASSIQDLPHNITRFLVVGSNISDRSGNDKTSFLCSIKDKSGALYEIIKPLYDRKINMTKIESRPSKKRAWDYFFFIDVKGHVSDDNIKDALSEIEDKVRFLKVLGSYPTEV